MKWRLAFLALAALLLSSSERPRASTRGIDAACRDMVFETSRFTICTAKPGRHRIAMVDIGPNGWPIRSFSRLGPRLGKDLDQVAFAMNAGMYDLAGFPIGLYVEEGRERKPLNRHDGRRNFHLKPNGVFYGDATGWHVAATDDFAATSRAGLAFASQSGPMLVVDGGLHPAFSADGRSLHIRNGVGIDGQGNALFVISDDEISFGRFARLFRDALGCRHALYFDGFVSQLWDPVRGRRDSGIPLGPIVMVLQAEGGR